MSLNDSILVPAETIGLTHRVLIPPTATDAQPAPLLLMVHGYGGDERVMWIFKRAVPSEMAIVTPRAILDAPDEAGYKWFQHEGKVRITPNLESLESALERLQDFILALPNHYPIDLTRLVVMGFSQGAAMVNSFTLSNPDMVTGVVSLAGAMPETVPGVIPFAGMLADLAVFVAHGSKDETVPLRFAHYTRDTYKQLGAAVTYNEYPVAHKMSGQGIRDLRTWLAKMSPNS